MKRFRLGWVLAMIAFAGLPRAVPAFAASEAKKLEKAEKLFLESQYEKALEIVDTLIRKNPTFLDSYTLKIRILVAQKQFDSAQNTYTLLLQTAAGDQPAALAALSWGVIIQSFSDKNFFVRGSAALALGEIGDERALRPLEYLLNDPFDIVKVRAVEAMGVLRKQEAVPLLIRLVNDKNYLLRSAAVESLGKLGNQESLHVLYADLDSRLWNVRARAAEQLHGFRRLGGAVRHLLEAVGQCFERLADGDGGPVGVLRGDAELLHRVLGPFELLGQDADALGHRVYVEPGLLRGEAKPRHLLSGLARVPLELHDLAADLLEGPGALQREHHAAEDVVLRLLLARQLVERHETVVLLQVGPLLGAVGPAFSHLLRHPAFVAGLRPGLGVLDVQLHAKERRVTLPLRRVFPVRMAGVAKRQAVGAVHFVTHARDLFDVHEDLSSWFGWCQ
jgi:tetratricopeptide (TPR) repeat protein